MSEQDRKFAMNRVSVETGEVQGRDVIVLVVEDVESGLRMDTILPNSTEVARLVESLNAAVAELRDRYKP